MTIMEYNYCFINHLLQLTFFYRLSPTHLSSLAVPPFNSDIKPQTQPTYRGEMRSEKLKYIFQ